MTIDEFRRIWLVECEQYRGRDGGKSGRGIAAWCQAHGVSKPAGHKFARGGLPTPQILRATGMRMRFEPRIEPLMSSPPA